jgi:Fic family protein
VTSKPTPPAWPPTRRQSRPWHQSVRGGTRADRMLGEISVSLPPLIAALEVPVNSALATDVESAVREIAALDSSSGEVLDALGVLLLRTESVASSKIERIQASMEDYARALHGVKTNSAAVSMVAATKALTIMVDSVGQTHRIDLETITKAHAALMADEPSERDYAGRLRTMQNWIGGSDHSPRAALYIPPPPDTVANYLDDLLEFSNRDDLPALVQAAIAHAQFESIHPFTDGNGRIGRALINSILRRRQITTKVVVPLASALAAHRDRYFDLLTAYREGDPGQILSSFATSARIAARESRKTATRLGEVPSTWKAMTGPMRRDNASGALLTHLLGRPILSAEDARVLLGTSTSASYAAIERLADAGILRPLTARKRNQVWGAVLVLDELDDLGVRIARSAR